jgi:toxin ParE1/3/4
MNIPQRRFRVSAQAKEELYQIWKDIVGLSGSYDSADAIVDSIRSKFRLVLDFPLAGRSRPEVAPEIRSLVARSGYVVYYRVTDVLIEIVHIAHGSRLPETVFEEDIGNG